jgi:mannose/fructose/N-acetylgalactosamine-specific phosphotransferase system component IIC
MRCKSQMYCGISIIAWYLAVLHLSLQQQQQQQQQQEQQQAANRPGGRA